MMSRTVNEIAGNNISNDRRELEEQHRAWRTEIPAKPLANQAKNIQHVNITGRVIGENAFCVKSSQAPCHRMLGPAHKRVHIRLITAYGQPDPNTQ
ncbi:hypothetical protein D3C77_564070 [compost metagenome]